MKDFKTVLFATDFSENSEYAFEYALAMARKYESLLVIVHVINEPVDLRGFYVPHISFESLEEEIEEGARKMMEKFCRMHIADYENYQTFIVPGIPYDEIIKKAMELPADLIIMGTQGRSGLDHVLFGSTAEKVVRKSPVPVMTVRVPA
ncbi:universal stress protein Usp [Syntrophotalea carbinolica DSM 2380]|uniref:Universal stress protein n=1 Tax=Syntrophotalea carbinolica (strain DSM 2380 / NBRC 103641 / GraBd1) TaxID=338963 RepID=Q3A300_SYNC1|nr:universal stress protein [Syntrophotalea carbinolica]ABA89257.1 universal stress protein Usp [Syntrophotalea carbinolica DSM 2380]